MSVSPVTAPPARQELERLENDAEAGTVTYTSDKAEGPTAAWHRFQAAEFIALLVAQIPDKGQVLQR